MKKISKISLIILALLGNAFSSMADRGIGRKNKNKISLNLSIPSGNIKNSISFNLKMGLKYTGSLLTKENANKDSRYITTSTLVTYQKGNTVYIIPYKQKVIVPEIKQGYTGMKLILRYK